MKNKMINLDKELPALPKYITLASGKRVKSFCGELYGTDENNYIGGIYRVADGYEVYRAKEFGRGERIARLPGTFKGSDFIEFNTLRISQLSTVRMFRLK